ncbi:competence/damage-inducible protein A [Synechococcus sp. Nb3U1]|uniref:competence/damage-inducible protein A n=1 Tax=Synechococcus sp. Nb3U1 TaxID=1914529 RepID=UPI001F41B2EE|nr:competence/damage-inducible protein A [Synechococcus sp. Nb3U1]MCF2972165.1 competence/damage-inducible protein A [Synechococcus sp. Nb3U1]
MIPPQAVIPQEAEILCIGTELLLGEITNTNAQYLATELAQLGIPHHYQTVVGDNEARIHHALEVACGRSSLILTTGGLGPTPDDLTHEALASFFGVEMVEHPQVWEEILQKYGQRGIVPSSSNRKQALLPKGAAVLPNPVGSACGLIWQPRPNLRILTFPGVPREMHRMWQETAVPYLRSVGWGQEVFHSQVLRHWGIPESTLAERVGSLLAGKNPTVAPYASQGEVRLRVTGRAPTREQAQALIAPVIQQILEIAGEDYFGSDEATLASVVGELLLKQGQTLAVAESCTGGLLGQLLTGIPGSSGYFLGGVVAYDNRIKEHLLGVDPATLERYGAVSKPVAAQMALGAKQTLGSDWALSITGIAGPDGGTATKPVGLVYLGLADPDGKTEVQEYQFGSLRGREGVRWWSAQTALDRLRRRLLRR